MTCINEVRYSLEGMQVNVYLLSTENKLVATLLREVLVCQELLRSLLVLVGFVLLLLGLVFVLLVDAVK